MRGPRGGLRRRAGALTEHCHTFTMKRGERRDSKNESYPGSSFFVHRAAARSGRWGRTVLSATYRGIAWLLRAVPTLIVGAALCGLFYWGHTTNWSAPKFSTLF